LALNSYGSILSFAIDFESRLQSFYDAAAAFDDTFGDTAQRYARRKTRLIQVRQDHVTEMVLEPISGLDESDYGPAPVAAADRSGALTEARRLEALAAKFYGDAGPKMNVTEVIRTFQKLARENADRLDKFNGMQ
jgi:hypothetical protein